MQDHLESFGELGGRPSRLKRTTWKPVRCVIPDANAYDGSTGCHALVTLTGIKHISVSAKGRYPTWDELTSARDRFAPDVRMVMHFPTTEEYVNVHETCLHLWEVES